MSTEKTIAKVADGVFYLTCDNDNNYAGCFVNDFTEKHIKEHKIQKGSALIVNPTVCNHQYQCEPSSKCLEYFKHVCFVINDMRDNDEFAKKLHMQASFKKQGTALFANYEDAYRWSVKQLTEQSD